MEKNICSEMIATRYTDIIWLF